MSWTKEEKYYASLLIRIKNHLELSRNRCNPENDNNLLLREETQKTIASPGS